MDIFIIRSTFPHGTLAAVPPPILAILNRRAEFTKIKNSPSAKKVYSQVLHHSQLKSPQFTYRVILEIALGISWNLVLI